MFMPLSSSVILFLVKYCKAKTFHIHLVDCKHEESEIIKTSITCLEDLKFSFIDRADVPLKVANCVLPVIEDDRDLMIRCGLCSVVRHIIKTCRDSAANSEDSLIDLLGFRAASLKACAEVSGWTKLCEVELPETIYQLIAKLSIDTVPTAIEMPENIMKLELHFDQPPLLHNDDKKKRLLLKSVQKEFEDVTNSPHIEKGVIKSFFANRENFMPHGNISYRVITKEEKDHKKFASLEKVGDACKYGCNENRLVKWCAKCNDREKLRRKEEKQQKNNARLTEERNGYRIDMNGASTVDSSRTGNIDSASMASLEELCDYVNTLTLHDIEYEHMYAEGVYFTVADIVLFVYIYHLLESLKFSSSRFLQKLPNVKKWLTHILSLPRIQHTSFLCGFKIDDLEKSVKEVSDHSEGPEFSIPVVTLNVEENASEISRSSKAKQRTLKKDISKVLEKVKDNCINPVVGHHPYGDNVQVDWSSVPLLANPKIELPEKRVARKCEQLENLATAVQAIASPGDVIVDFCSGAGHLGIIIAYLLPNCQVYLIENKEESLGRASQRVKQLRLDNVTLYQCNLDYFQGHFDIGVCLHACGVATDLVLQQCLDRKASFVICPCCYGSIQNTHLISYPRSQCYRKAGFIDKDVIVLGHAADQTEENTELLQQGRHCMNLVDTDRARLAEENGYDVTLCSLKPLSCTPKNNLLIGTRCQTVS